MTIDGAPSYPGEAAAAEQVARLAGEYRRAAEALLQDRRRGEPLSHAPFRMVAIHGIELYLNALLLAGGHSAAMIRGLQHDLAARTSLAAAQGLMLRARTASHLQTLSDTREYLLARYEPAPPTWSELNRLAATLAEVADKTGLLLRTCSPRRPAAKGSPAAGETKRQRVVSAH